jgi:hypothetical protein
MYLYGSTHTGGTRYDASALPNEPFRLTVSKRIGSERVVLHEQELTLKPGEDRIVEIPIGFEAP